MDYVLSQKCTMAEIASTFSSLANKKFLQPCFPVFQALRSPSTTSARYITQRHVLQLQDNTIDYPTLKFKSNNCKDKV